MNILIAAHFVQTEKEKGNSRFTYLANLLSKNNNVEILTSTFYHTSKKQRTQEEMNDEGLNYKLTFIEEPSYKKNVSIKRIFAHKKFAKNVINYLKKRKKPDVIYLAVPSLDFGKVLTNYAKKNHIRIIIDVQDLWPEAFQMVFKLPIISNLIFYPMKKKANYIYKNADDIVAVSNTYMDRAMKVNKTCKNKKVVFLGTDLEFFDNCKELEEEIHKKDTMRIVYIGTLGYSYNIKLVIDALELLNEKYKNLEFIIMGDGPLKSEFQKYADHSKANYRFIGKLDYPEMIKKICNCDIAVNPIINGSAGSIINKVGDYAAAGLPVINTQESKEYKEIVDKYKIGFNCKNDKYDMANKIEILLEDKELRIQMGENNRKVAEEKFDRKKTYPKIVKIIEGN